MDDDGVAFAAAQTPITPAIDGYAEMGTAEQMAALYEALATAQGGFSEIKRSRTVTIRTREGSAYSFSYAPLEDLLAATRPALAANGLSVLTPIVRGQADGTARVLVVLAHKGGGRLVTGFAFTPRGDMKEVAGQITYLRRYGYSAALNLAADDDDDDAPPVQPKKTTAKAQATAETDEPASLPPIGSTPKVTKITNEHDPLWTGRLELERLAEIEQKKERDDGRDFKYDRLTLPIDRDELEMLSHDLKEEIRKVRAERLLVGPSAAQR